jgi:hypothetical protein
LRCGDVNSGVMPGTDFAQPTRRSSRDLPLGTATCMIFLLGIGVANQVSMGNGEVGEERHAKDRDSRGPLTNEQ